MAEGSLSGPVRTRRGRSEALIKGAEFHKRYRADLAQEFEKAGELYRLSERCGFTAPRPLRLDADSGSIVFARLSGLRSIRDLFLEHVCRRQTEAAPAVFGECGRVLAVIHEQLVLSDREPWEFFGHFDPLLEGVKDVPDEVPAAFLHGDYGFANVFVVEGQRGIVVLDASPNYFVTFSTACHGPIYVDISNMLSCMDGLVPWSRHLRMNLGCVRELERSFIEGYESASGVRLDRALLEQFAEATSLTYLEQRLGSRLLGRMGHLVLYNPLRRSYLRPVN